MVAIGLLAAAVAVATGSESASGYLATGGFLLLALASRNGSRVAVLIALLFAVYGGLSALFAIADLERKTSEIAPEIAAMRDLGVFSSVGHPSGPGPNSFRYAMLATCLGGLSAVIAAHIAHRRVLRHRKWRPEALDAPRGDPVLAEKGGRALVAVGMLGILLAAGRYAATTHVGETPWESLKSLWTGGSYALLLVLFAIPGFGLWLHGLLSRRAPRRELMTFAGVLVFFGLVSLATGQRGFLIELTLVTLVAVGWHYRVSRRAVIGLAVSALVVLGVTQAIRNSVRETGTVSPGNLASRLAPENLNVLFGSQFASFAYTWDVAHYRPQLHLPNSFAAVLEKPVPRQIYPGKSQGFGDEFTRVLYPSASAQQVTFATPLVAESDYAFGLAGVLIVLGLLGAAAGYTEARVVARSPIELRPAMAAGLIWIVFSLVRGDLANALFNSAGWVVPLAAISIAVGFVPNPQSRRAMSASRFLRRSIEFADPAGRLPARLSRALVGR
jgi:hypothetical protein